MSSEQLREHSTQPLRSSHIEKLTTQQIVSALSFADINKGSGYFMSYNLGQDNVFLMIID